ncbi:tape measure protein [Leisingera sp. M658]|uniref:tape measure protein n=1 Tax=Leisingera sp. M658 TaxID=2867015 RepID=UPI0021A62F99|nr:tape measure protein [Leisingera sp. M658]UWQ77398.1 tape measure protein [Leisingera sp. M658]
MQARDTILTEYTGDVRGFARASRFYDQTLARQEQLTNHRLTRIDQRWERSNRAILNTTTALRGVTAALALGALRSYAEEWRNVERRLASVGETSEASQQKLIELALRTRSVAGSTADAVQRMSKSTNADYDTTLRRVETLQKLLAAGGASGSERASVSLQLGQALKSGRLSGDEFRSISENAPIEFLDALSRAAGIARKDLKEFASDQLLTTEIVLEALDGLATTADAKFRALAVSGEEAVDVLNTGLTAYIGRVDESLGATEAINGAMVALGQYAASSGEGAENLAAAIQIVGVAAAATAGSRGIGAMTGALVKASAARKADVAAAQQQIVIAKAQEAQSRKNLDAANARVRALHVERQARIENGKSIKRITTQMAAADAAQVKSANALAGATLRRTAATDALTAAQKRLSVAARLTATTMRGLQGIMAFFGGPVGLAFTAITTALTVMALRTSEVDRLTGAVTDRVNLLRQAYAETGGEVDELRRKMASTSVAQAIAQADELKEKLQEAKESIQGDLYQAESRGKFDEFPEIGNLVQDLLSGEKAVSEFRAELNDLVREGGPELQQFALIIEGILQPVLNVADASESADAVLAVLRGTSEEAAAALEQLGFTAGAAGGQVEVLAAKASTAAKGISDLVAMIPELSKAAKVQEKLGKAAAARDAALSGLGDPLAWGPEQAAKAEEINDLYNRAAGEIDGTADATRRANKELDTYLDNSRIGALDARNQAVARENQEFEKIVANLQAVAAGEEALAAARAAHKQNLAQINERFDKRGSGGAGREVGSSERLYELRELLLENGQKSVYTEAALNAERERLLELVPELIKLGYSRAEAEALVADQLDRVKDRLAETETASEQASQAMSRGIFNDIRHAESLSDALGSIKDRLLDIATDNAFDLLAEQLANLDYGLGKGSGGGGGGLDWGSLIGGIFGGKRATGGRVQAGKIYPVNEQTTNSELFVPSQDGTVLNVAQAQAALKQASGQANAVVAVRDAPQVNIYNNAKGAEVSAKSGPGGRLDITIVDQFSKAIGSGKLDKAFRGRFGVKPTPKGA